MFLPLTSLTRQRMFWILAVTRFPNFPFTRHTCKRAVSRWSESLFYSAARPDQPFHG